jgi:hypothetical protein
LLIKGDKVSKVNNDYLLEEKKTKRVDITEQNLSRLEKMIPTYKDEAGSGKNSDIASYIVNQAIEKFFREDFIKRLESL